MLPFSQPSCYFKTRPPSCALGTSFYTISEGSDLMRYVNDHYTSYSAPSPLNVKVHYKRRGPGHEKWYMASLQNGGCNR